MKKLTTIALAALMAVSLALPTAAANVDKVGANANTVKTTFAAATKTPVIDGVVKSGEYQEIKYTADDLYFCGANDTYLKKAQDTKFKMYATYDAANVYVAVVIDTPDYISVKATKEKPSPIYEQYGLQLCTAPGSETDAAKRSEFAITRNSDTNDLLYASYVDSYGAKLAPVGGKDFAVVTKDGVTTYEMIIPAKAFNKDSLKKGDTIRLCITNLLSTKWGTEVCVVEWGNGCFTTKSSQQYPVITLGDAMKAPTPAAAATADAASITVFALAASAAAAVVIAKKH